MNTALHYVAYCGILPTYLNYVKGGYSDPDGRFANDKGGSTEVEVVGGSREAIAEKQATARLYRSRFLARQAGGLERVSRATIQLTRREQVNAGYFLPATPRMLHTSYHAVSSIPMLTLPVCILHTPRQERQESRRVLL